MMTKRDLLALFDTLPYFTIEGFKQVLGVGEDEAQRARELLARWANQGHILRLKRGVYMTRQFYLMHQGEASFRPAVSAIILPQSYLSLQYVLQRAGVLTEATFPVTGVTYKKPRTIENVLGTFDYRHIQRKLYSGFTYAEYHGVIYQTASSAKALFDFFYYYPLPRDYRSSKISLAEDLRLNVDELSLEDQKEFTGYITKTDSSKMNYVLENLRRHVWLP